MTMTMTYVFPDLHGRLDHFVAAMRAVGNDYIAPDDTLVFLGDYIDRGPESAQLVKELRKLAEARDKVICLSGNHEYMMIWGLTEGGEALSGWMINGGVQTVESYTNGLGELDENAMREDVLWFSQLPTWHGDDHRVYVHAGVSQHYALEDQPLQTLHWHRYENMDGTGYCGKHVVHGHTPNKLGPVTVGNRTALDVGAVWTGRYVVAVFDDTVEGGPVRVLEAHG